MKRIFALFLTAALTAACLMTLSACGKTEKAPGEGGEADMSETIAVQIEMEDGGIIKLELYPGIAPITCENFVNLAKDGFYDGLIFHRVIEGFMIQGGCPEGTGFGGSGKNIKGEFASNGVENNLKHERGVVSMARSKAMDSASSQFFICHDDAPHLDGDYAAFGRVTEGMDVVDAIAAVAVDGDDKPLTDVVIKTITVIEWE